MMHMALIDERAGHRKVRSGDGPLSVRARPSSPSATVPARQPARAEKATVNVHATSCLTPATTADIPVRNQETGRSLPGPGAGHSLHGV
jgi:hypothetical protein